MYNQSERHTLCVFWESYSFRMIQTGFVFEPDTEINFFLFFSIF